MIPPVSCFKEKGKDITSYDIFALYLFKVAQAKNPVKKRIGNYDRLGAGCQVLEAWDYVIGDGQ